MAKPLFIVRRHYAYINELDVPNEAEHAVEHEVVFSASIFEIEGDYPTAEFEILNPRRGLGSYPKEWVLISFTIAYDDGTTAWMPFFRGRLEEWPLGIENEFITISVKAEPTDALDRRETVLEPYRVAPFYDVAFIAGDDPVDDPSAQLEARPALVHWDRLTLEPSLVSLIDAPETFDIGRDWFRDGWKITKDPNPLDVVRVLAPVQWTQPVQFDYPYSVFGRTMTPRSIEKGLPKAGSSLGNGYTVTHSYYSEVPYDVPMYEVNHAKTSTGGLGSLGRIDPPNREYVQRLFFLAQVYVAVSYQIQRFEKVEVSVAWNGQASAPERRGREKKMTVQISGDGVSGYKPYRARRDYDEGDIVIYAGVLYAAVEDFKSGDSFAEDQVYAPAPDYTIMPRWERVDSGTDLRFGDTIFGTTRGNAMMKHMTLIGHAVLAKSRRHVGNEFPMRIVDALDAKATMMAHAIGPLPGGEVTGKIVAIDFVSSTEREQAIIRIKSVPGTGLSPDFGGIGGGGEIDRDIYSGNDPAGVYPLSNYQDGSGFTVARPDWWPMEYAWPPEQTQDPFALYVYERPPMAYPFDPENGFPAQRPFWWPGADTDDDGVNDTFYYSWPPESSEGCFGYIYAEEGGSSGGDDEDDPTEDDIYVWDGDDFIGFYEAPVGGWGARPSAALYPPERSWPPVKNEDSFGVYSHVDSKRFKNGVYYEVLPPAGRQPLLTIDPYVVPAGGWPAKPSWWTRVIDYGSGITSEFDIGVYPPERGDDIWGLYRIAPNRDDTIDDGDGEEEFDGVILKASAPSWDWLGLPNVNFPVSPIVTDLIKNEIIYSGDLQDFILRSSFHNFWAGAGPARLYPRPQDANAITGPRSPNPAQEGFTPQRWLPEMETSIEFDVKDMGGYSTSTGYKMRVLWNGPKHINLEAPSYDS